MTKGSAATLRHCRSGAASPAIDDLIGGLCNRSFVVTDSNRKLVVRIGFDIPVHGIMQHSALGLAHGRFRYRRHAETRLC